MSLGSKRRQDVPPHEIPVARIVSLSAKLLDALSIEMLDIVREAEGAYRDRLRRLVESRLAGAGPGKPTPFH